jgi:hypothetical protein
VFGFVTLWTGASSPEIHTTHLHVNASNTVAVLLHLNSVYADWLRVLVLVFVTGVIWIRDEAQFPPFPPVLGSKPLCEEIPEPLDIVFPEASFFNGKIL